VGLELPSFDAATIGRVEETRLVRIPITDPAGEPKPLTPWLPRVDELWIARGGEWVTWIEPNVPSDEPEQLVVRHGAEERRLPLPGYGGRAPSLTPARDAALYQRAETARLTVIDLATGRIRGELDEREFYGGEISQRGILAAPTAHGPWETNELCLIDVHTQLSALAAGDPSVPDVPPLLPEDAATRSALLAAAGRGEPLDATAVFPTDWRVVHTFRPRDDNVTARQALGSSFDLEAAMASLGGRPGVVFVGTDGGRVRGWFSVTASRLDVLFAGGGFVPDDARLEVRSGEPPRLDWTCNDGC
jgi:hypothetical protein